jgi:hypothetical protein
MSLGNVIAFRRAGVAEEKHALVCAVEDRDVAAVGRLCLQSPSQGELNAALLAAVRGFQRPKDDIAKWLCNKLLVEGANPYTCQHVSIPRSMKKLFGPFFREWRTRHLRKRHA